MKSFELSSDTSGVQYLKIKKAGICADGFYLPNAVFSYDDDKKSILSYPDMGLLVLLPGSPASPSVPEKYSPYIENGRTTRTIIFQSRNAAAKFVLGTNGKTSDWK